MDEGSGLPAELASVFMKWGVRLPPIPPELASRLKRLRPEAYSTRPLQVSPYDLLSFIEEACASPFPEDFVVVAQAGHGVNSHALHFYLALEKTVLLLQLPWGGAYMDVDACRGNIDRCFTAAEALLASRRSRSSKPERLVLVGSGFYGSWKGVGDHLAFEQVTLSVRVSPEDILNAALERSQV